MNISLSVQSAAATRPGAYRTDITITSVEGITEYLFVKQRIIRADGSVDDDFAAVASPAQIEDLPQQAPIAPGTYWRDNNVSLISSDPVLMQDVVDTILADLQFTLTQLTELETLGTTIKYVISPTGIATV